MDDHPASADLSWLRGRGPTLGPTPGLTIGELLTGYRSGVLRPTSVIEDVLDRIARRGDDGTWISLVDRAELLARASQVERDIDPCDPSAPLYGIPFGVKDSIDVMGAMTTLACPDFAYLAQASAAVVERLMAAGAIVIGKTNLDQFATGLNGTRTPYAVPRSVFGGNLISGGSSSGSALAVATGDVPFAVATDTAGSGRVPPALNGVLGFKPSRGLISTVGLVPACRSLDCVSLMATTVADLAVVFDVVAAADDRDPSTRERRRERTDPAALVVGLPSLSELEFFGDDPMRAAHVAARSRLEARVSRTVVVPFGPFAAAGELLYQGPWVAERLAEFGDFVAEHPDSILPVVGTILRSGNGYTAVDVFTAEHRVGELRAQVAALWRRMDVLVLPAIGTTFTVDEVLADPIATNTALGHYTHFGNLLDLCAVVVPAGLTADGRPAALMVLGPALADDRVLALAGILTGQAALAPPTELAPPTDTAALTPPEERTTLVVVGLHLSGQPANADLVAAGGRLLERTRTAPAYRLLRVDSGHPVPALMPVTTDGVSVEAETWSVPSGSLASILTSSSPMVCLGRVTLLGGRVEIGFVGTPEVLDRPGVADISPYGGWRGYLASVAAPQAAPVG